MKKFLWFLALFTGLSVKAENLISLDFQRNTLSNGFSLGFEKKKSNWGYYAGIRYQTAVLPYNLVDSDEFRRRIRPEKFQQLFAPSIALKRFFNIPSNHLVSPFLEISALQFWGERMEFSRRLYQPTILYNSGIPVSYYVTEKTGQKVSTTDLRISAGFRHFSTKRLCFDFLIGYSVQRINVGPKTNALYCIDEGIYFRRSPNLSISLKYVL